MLFVIASAAVVVAFIAAVRLAPLLLWGRPSLATGDVMNHLYLIDRCRQQGRALPDLSDKFLVSDPEDYPTWYHRLLSRFSQETVDWLEPAFGTIVESLHGAIVFFFAYGLARESLEQEPSLAVALFASSFFAITPLLLGIENHGRVYRLSPRPVGALLVSTSLLALLQYQLGGSIAWLCAAVIVGGIATQASKFAVQALLFFGLFLSAFLGSAVPLALPVLSVAAAVVMSRGGYLRVLRGHIRHSYVYCTYLRKRFRNTDRPFYREVVLLPWCLVADRNRAVAILAGNHHVISVLLVPWVVVLAASFFVEPTDRGVSPVEVSLGCWVLAGYASLLLTTTPWFRFLGEGSRYVVYSVDAICILTALRLVALSNSTLWWLTAAMAMLAIGGVFASWWAARLVRRNDPDRMKLYAWMKQQPASTMLTIDLRLSFLLCFRLPHRAVHYHINAPRGEKLEEFKELVPRFYPWPTTNLDAVIERYEVGLVVVDDRAVEVAVEADPTYVYDLSGYTEVFRQGRFRVLRVDSKQTICEAA